MKKTKLYKIGALASIITPIVTVISCGSSKQNEAVSFYEIKSTNISMLRKLNQTQITSKGEIKRNTRSVASTTNKEYKKIQSILGKTIKSINISSKRSNILKGKIYFEAKILSESNGKKSVDTYVLDFNASKAFKKDMFSKEDKNINLIDYIKVNGKPLKENFNGNSFKEMAVSFIANKLNEFVRQQIENKIANIKLPK